MKKRMRLKKENFFLKREPIRTWNEIKRIEFRIVGLLLVEDWGMKTKKKKKNANKQGNYQKERGESEKKLKKQKKFWK